MRAKSLLLSILDPRAWLHLVRMVHYFNYSHVAPRRSVSLGRGVALAPTVSFRNGHRIRIGHHSQIGDGTFLWAGRSEGTITIGDYALFGPNVYITASNYATPRGKPVMHQSTIEKDVVIGSNVWLGHGVTVLPGVHIGDGCVVGAGAIVTSDLPAECIAVGVPARAIGERCKQPNSIAGSAGDHQVEGRA